MNTSFQECDSIYFDMMNFKNFPKWKITFLKEIWIENKLSQASFVREQIYGLYVNSNKKYNSTDYRLTYTDLGDLFGLTKQRIMQLIEKHQKILDGNLPKPFGRQSLLTLEQKNSLVQWISQQHKEQNPPTVDDVTEYVRGTLKVECSSTWANKWINSKDTGLFVVDAIPLEKERIDVTLDILKAYEKKIQEELKTLDPEFLFNCDETGLDDRKYGNKSVVSTENSPTCYKVLWPAGHITVLPTICADGSTARPMVIIARKSIDNEILKYGLPNGMHGYVVSSPKGYMTTDLFECYFEDILIPHIKKKRLDRHKQLQKAVLLMDGFCAHSSDKVTKLSEDNNVKIVFIPPHSSHLTQPLDLLIFSTFKKTMLKISTTFQLSELSKRIVMALKGIQMSTNFFDILTSFYLAGFIISLELQKESLSFDLARVMKNDRAPENEVKKEENKKKKKRTKLKAGIPKAKKQKKSNNVLIPSSSTTNQNGG